MSGSIKDSTVFRAARAVNTLLASSEFALALLVAILLCCLAGVTVVRGEEAWRYIFSTAWFNGLLVFLVLSATLRFAGRVWGKKPTLINVGMLLFHLCFVTILVGIIYNSLFYFRANLRLSEGETLPNAELVSYDYYSQGRFFDLARLKGETTLVKMHRGYKVEGEDKVVAYEVEVGEGGSSKHGIIYITHSLEHGGFRYLRDREGYSILIMLYDREGSELYGAVVPLQSLRRDGGVYLHTTGTKTAPGSFPFPAPPASPIFFLQAALVPSQLEERGGQVHYSLWPFSHEGTQKDQSPIANGVAPRGQKFAAGDYQLAMTEVRYWAAMDVRHDPGYPIILSSLWVGLTGMILTFIGRLRARKATKNEASAEAGQGETKH